MFFVRSWISSARNKSALKRCKKAYGKEIKLLDSNSIFEKKYEGARCFILGNGPSIKTLDFAILKNEFVFTVNQLAKNPNFPKLDSNFHFWADHRFFEFDFDNPTEGDLELIQSMINVKNGDTSPEVFYDLSAYPMIKRFNLDSLLNIHYFALASVERDFFFRDHSYNLSKCVPDFSTVVQTCICAAVYMGFKTIVLLGCDQTSILTIIQSKVEQQDIGGYGYDVSKAEQNRLREFAKKSTLANEFRWQADILDAYEFLFKYCQSKGVKLLNATEGSLIESIPKVSLKELLSNE